MSWRELAAAARARGLRDDADFDAGLFDAVCAAVAPDLEASLEGDDHALADWLRLVAEAIARGLVRSTDPGRWTHFAEWSLLALAPDHLATLEPQDRTLALARVFNLAEGLAAHAEFVDRYVLARAHDGLRLDELDRWLVDVLDPLFRPLPPVRWRGPWSVRWLDCATAAADFLPGELALVTPTVVAVRDRRQPRTLAVRVAPGGDNEVLGFAPEVREALPVDGAPRLRAGDGYVLVGDVRVELPMVRAPRQVLPTPAGVVVVSAQDSQRLWLLAAP